MSQASQYSRVDGVEVRARYFDDLEEACEVARSGCALLDLPWCSHLVVTGPHARRFVHNMTTCQVKELSSGEGRFGMTVDSGGKLVTDFFLEAEEDRLVIESSQSGVEAMAAHLKSHIIADRVVLEVASQGRVVALTGDGSAEVLAHACEADLSGIETYGWSMTTIAGHDARLRRNPHRLGVEGWDITVAEETIEEVRAALLNVGATAIGHEAYEICRVLAGVPRVPDDMGQENVPLESDVLYETIDWDKGCYIGQEVIAMMHYRGRPNRHLRGLALPSSDPTPGAAITTDEGKEVGTLGSVVSLPGGGGAVGLAVIKRKHADAGNRLHVAGQPVEVLILPLA